LKLPQFSKYDILSGLRADGVTEGMVLGVHSSLRSVGQTEEGAKTTGKADGFGIVTIFHINKGD
jgi:aminoglycoside N3'-acetyltransferase